MQDELLRLREVCDRTRLSRATIYRFIKSGDFPRYVRVGSRTSRWRASDIADWLRRLH